MVTKLIFTMQYLLNDYQPANNDIA